MRLETYGISHGHARGGDDIRDQSVSLFNKAFCYCISAVGGMRGIIVL